jgi:hypothetical protein
MNLPSENGVLGVPYFAVCRHYELIVYIHMLARHAYLFVSPNNYRDVHVLSTQPAQSQCQ